MRLNDKIIIQELTETPDGQGGYTEAWTTYATVYANIRPLRSKELFQAKQVQSEAILTITIRYMTIDDTKRVVCNSKAYNIESVIDINNRHRFMELLCTGGETFG